MAPPFIPIEQRFWARVAPASVDDCWQWLGYIDPDGYGRISRPGGQGQFMAHRWAYEALVTDIPNGLVLDHLCRNRGCVNPWHVEPVPNGVNVMRGESPAARNARKTHCMRGHEFTPDNTYPAKGGRACRRCHLEKSKAKTRAKAA